MKLTNCNGKRIDKLVIVGLVYRSGEEYEFTKAHGFD